MPSGKRWARASFVLGLVLIAGAMAGSIAPAEACTCASVGPPVQLIIQRPPPGKTPE